MPKEYREDLLKKIKQDRFVFYYKLTPQEYQLVADYTDEYYKELNDLTKQSEQLIQDRRLLASVIKKISLVQPPVERVFAGIGFSIPRKWRLDRFRSTTDRFYVSFNQNISVEFLYPSNGAFINSMSVYPEESEYLIVPGHCYQMIDMNLIDGVAYILVEPKSNNKLCREQVQKRFDLFVDGKLSWHRLGKIYKIPEIFRTLAFYSFDWIHIKRYLDDEAFWDARDIFNHNCLNVILLQEDNAPKILDYLLKYHYRDLKFLANQRNTLGENAINQYLRNTRQNFLVRERVLDRLIPLIEDLGTDIYGRNIRLALQASYPEKKFSNYERPEIDFQNRPDLNLAKDVFGRNYHFYRMDRVIEDLDIFGQNPLIYLVKTLRTQTLVIHPDYFSNIPNNVLLHYLVKSTVFGETVFNLSPNLSIFRFFLDKLITNNLPRDVLYVEDYEGTNAILKLGLWYKKLYDGKRRTNPITMQDILDYKLDLDRSNKVGETFWSRSLTSPSSFREICPRIEKLGWPKYLENEPKECRNYVSDS